VRSHPAGEPGPHTIEDATGSPRRRRCLCFRKSSQTPVSAIRIPQTAWGMHRSRYAQFGEWRLGAHHPNANGCRARRTSHAYRTVSPCNTFYLPHADLQSHRSRHRSPGTHGASLATVPAPRPLHMNLIPETLIRVFACSSPSSGPPYRILIDASAEMQRRYPAKHQTLTAQPVDHLSLPLLQRHEKRTKTLTQLSSRHLLHN
jgi:hypothetical protein